ncbi:MAG: hypothetical protein LBC92_00050 [Rickettsiales bacterium]|jgi:serine/threonine protein kinase|nr:hypothetical protein [Rickettsiales bacterium]
MEFVGDSIDDADGVEFKKYINKHDAIGNVRVKKFSGVQGCQSNNFRVNYNYIKNNEYKKKNLFVKVAKQGGNAFNGDSLIIQKKLKKESGKKLHTYPIYVNDRGNISMYNDFSANFKGDENSYSMDLMELIRRRRNKEKPLPITECQINKIVTNVVDELRKAHMKGVGHCDVTPDNIIVGIEDGVPTCGIIDWSLTKDYNDIKPRPSSKHLFTSNTIKDIRKLDIFSLGISFAYLFDGDKFEELRQRELINLHNFNKNFKIFCENIKNQSNIDIGEEESENIKQFLEYPAILDYLGKINPFGVNANEQYPFYNKEATSNMASKIADAILNRNGIEDEEISKYIKNECNNFFCWYVNSITRWCKETRELTQDNLNRIISEMNISDDKKCLLSGMLRVNEDERWDIERVKLVLDNIDTYPRVKDEVLKITGYNIDDLDIKKRDFEELNKVLTDEYIINNDINKKNNRYQNFFRDKMLIKNLEIIKYRGLRSNVDKNMKREFDININGLGLKKQDLTDLDKILQDKIIEDTYKGKLISSILLRNKICDKNFVLDDARRELYPRVDKNMIKEFGFGIIGLDIREKDLMDLDKILQDKVKYNSNEMKKVSNILKSVRERKNTENIRILTSPYRY